jgi:thiosulfate dehydrogenase (quinone) large subunit
VKPNLDQELALALFRFTLGVNFFMHGGVRLFGNLNKFIAGTTAQFQNSVLPAPFVQVFATTLPLIELALGILLVLGLFTRLALVVGALLMTSLIFGMGLLQKWDVVGLQMTYAIAFFLLLFFHIPNRFSLDGLRSRGRR